MQKSTKKAAPAGSVRRTIWGDGLMPSALRPGRVAGRSSPRSHIRRSRTRGAVDSLSFPEGRRRTSRTICSTGSFRILRATCGRGLITLSQISSALSMDDSTSTPSSGAVGLDAYPRTEIWKWLKERAGWSRILPFEQGAAYYISRYIGRDANRCDWYPRVGEEPAATPSSAAIGRTTVVHSADLPRSHFKQSCKERKR